MERSDPPGLPGCDQVIALDVQPDQTLRINRVATSIESIASVVDSLATGKRPMVGVTVHPPPEVEPEFVQFVRSVQDEVRKATKPVLWAYRTVRE